MTGIGIGLSDFKTLRLRRNYYIDTTEFIKHIIDNQSSVVLITRPRRFGKTLNMSTLRYYFDNQITDAKELFQGLKIMQFGKQYTSKMSNYPCIYLTLKDAGMPNYDYMIMQLKTIMMDLYFENKHLLEDAEMSEGERNIFNKMLSASANEIDLINGVKMLSKIMYRHYQKPVMLFLDEYDVPLQSAYIEGFYNEAVKFFKIFYGTTFKDNTYLQKTVITGVSRIAKESIFSGANNFDVYTVLDDEFATDFGITEHEIDKMIKDFNVEDEKDEIKKWYDGYKIGGQAGIYNPWSVLQYMKNKILQPYWVNTSSNDLIKMILKNSTTVKEKIERLLKDEPIEVRVDQETIMVDIEKNEDNIWGLLVGTGYLKPVDILDGKKCKVQIPNYEIRALFEDIVEDWFNDKVIGNDLQSILKDLVTLNLNEYKKKFTKLVLEMFSYMDVGENTAENFYHAFVLGMLVGLKDSYYVNSNRESGLGRYDIMLEPKDKNQNSFIMEFKVLESDEEYSLEDTIANAKKQIEDKMYEQNLRERGFDNITKMVYAFHGKNVKMEFYE